jgi:hypothetical protein
VGTTIDVLPITTPPSTSTTTSPIATFTTTPYTFLAAYFERRSVGIQGT